MWCAAICHDLEGAAARTELFPAHSAHNIARMGAFLFTGPFANADGATGIGDDPRLRGSIYCLDVDNLQTARELMEADPFMKGAWRQVDYYEWREPAGAWLSEAARPKGPIFDFRLYVAVSRSALAVSDALMTGALTPLTSTGSAAAPLASIAILRADSIEEARRRAAGAEWVASVPIAIGRWVRVSSAADLPTPAA